MSVGNLLLSRLDLESQNFSYGRKHIDKNKNAHTRIGISAFDSPDVQPVGLGARLFHQLQLSSVVSHVTFLFSHS